MDLFPPLSPPNFRLPTPRGFITLRQLLLPHEPPVIPTLTSPRSNVLARPCLPGGCLSRSLAWFPVSTTLLPSPSSKHSQVRSHRLSLNHIYSIFPKGSLGLQRLNPPTNKLIHDNELRGTYTGLQSNVCAHCIPIHLPQLTSFMSLSYLPTHLFP